MDAGVWFSREQTTVVTATEKKLKAGGKAGMMCETEACSDHPPRNVDEKYPFKSLAVIFLDGMALELAGSWYPPTLLGHFEVSPNPSKRANLRIGTRGTKIRNSYR